MTADEDGIKRGAWEDAVALLRWDEQAPYSGHSEDAHNLESGDNGLINYGNCLYCITYPAGIQVSTISPAACTSSVGCHSMDAT